MKCGLVLLAVLVSLFTILRPSVDCGIKWLSSNNDHLKHLSAHRTLPSSQGTHLRVTETCASISSPPPVDSACNSTGKFVINPSSALRGFTCPSWSRSRGADVTISSDLIIHGTPPKMWSLVFLCAVSQTLSVWRPAIGLVLALGLPQTEAAAPSKFLTNHLTSTTTNVPLNAPSKALSNAPANTPSYATDNAVQYSSKVPNSVAVTDTSAITAGSSDETAKRIPAKVSLLDLSYNADLPSAGAASDKPNSSESSSTSSSIVNKISERRGPSRYAPVGSEASQFVNNFNQRRSGSAPLCCLAVLAVTPFPDRAT
jgi:hypothetical protein